MSIFNFKYLYIFPHSGNDKTICLPTSSKYSIKPLEIACFS